MTARQSPSGTDSDAGADTRALQRARYTAMVLAAAQFMVGIDSTVLITAIPRMARDFGVAPTALSSTITIYVLISATLIPVSNWIAQRLGPRRVFIAAIVGFAASSVGCGLANSLPMFLAMRALQAVSGSLMAPVGNFVLLKITPKSYLVTAMALVSTPALVAPVIGPPLGGFITTFLHWPWVFFINVPIALVGVVFAARFVPLLPREPRTPFDFTGFALSAVMIFALITGLDRLGAHGNRWEIGAALLAAGLVVAHFAIRHARTAPHPIVSLTPLRYPCFHAATVGAAVFVRLPFSASGFILPLMLQIGLGLSPFQAGLLLLAQNAGDLALKSVAGKALRRLGFRSALMSGALMQAAAIAICAFLTANIPFPALFAILFLAGMARSILFTAMMAVRYADMPSAEVGGATVLGNMIQALTQATAISGAALLLNLLAGDAHAPDLASFRIALLALAALSAIAAPLFGRLHPDAGAEVSGRVERGFRQIRAAADSD